MPNISCAKESGLLPSFFLSTICSSHLSINMTVSEWPLTAGLKIVCVVCSPVMSWKWTCMTLEEKHVAVPVAVHRTCKPQPLGRVDKDPLFWNWIAWRGIRFGHGRGRARERHLQEGSRFSGSVMRPHRSLCSGVDLLIMWRSYFNVLSLSLLTTHLLTSNRSVFLDPFSFDFFVCACSSVPAA